MEVAELVLLSFFLSLSGFLSLCVEVDGEV